MLQSPIKVQHHSDVIGNVSHLVHLPICPIAHNLDQLKDSCWILKETQADSHISVTFLKTQKLHVKTVFQRNCNSISIFSDLEAQLKRPRSKNIFIF